MSLVLENCVSCLTAGSKRSLPCYGQFSVNLPVRHCGLVFQLLLKAKVTCNLVPKTPALGSMKLSVSKFISSLRSLVYWMSLVVENCVSRLTAGSKRPLLCYGQISVNLPVRHCGLAFQCYLSEKLPCNLLPKTRALGSIDISVSKCMVSLRSLV